MTHIVIYDRGPGAPEYHCAESLGAAVAEVERLRNAEGITESSIFELRPVPFEFQAYFRVSLEDELGDRGPDEDDDDDSDVPLHPIDLRAEDMSGFTTYPIGRRLFSR